MDMKKHLLPAFLLLLVLAGVAYYFIPRFTYYHLPVPSLPVSKANKNLLAAKTREQAASVRSFINKKKLSDEFCFLVDMSLPSGRKRFFVYDLKKDMVILSGLVAHGSCNTDFLEQASFSNTPNQGCSSVGRYSIGNSYKGQFGKAYKLHGLDSSNSNAYKRYVVLHAYDCVPDYEIHPQPLCNSLGCPMISYKFLEQLGKIIDQSENPVLLWVYQ
jgi:hypothetical protein